MLAVRGKKVGFDKIIKMIDVMVALLKEEQVDDDSKKEYCEMSLDKADDKKKVLKQSVSKLEKAIDEAKETIATLTDEIKALAAGIVALDKSVAEATEQRKEQTKECQNDTYYITGGSVAAVSSSPFLEAHRKKGLEVLYMCDPIDEYAVQQLKEFDGKKLKSCTKEGLDIDDDDEKKT